MHDLHTEGLITLREAGDLIPVPEDKKRHTGTLWNWCHRGVGGVRLESIRVGGSIFTSAAAVSRFLDAVDRKAGPVEHTSGDVALA